MPTIVVEVMPKAELLDPQGKAVTAAIGRLGVSGIEVRVGKRFELTVDEITDEIVKEVRDLSTTMLANTVIEDVVNIIVPEDRAVGETH